MKLHHADEEIVGHTKVRCTEPVKEANYGGYGAGGDTGGFDAPGIGEDFAAPAAAGGDAWAAGPTDAWATVPAAATVGGGVPDGW